MVETLVDILQQGASVTHKGYTFLNDRLEANEYAFSELAKEADKRARIFRSLGLKKGDRLAMIIPEGEDFVLSFLGAVRAGIVPVPMYPPLALGKLDTYVETASRILTSSGAKMLLTTKQVAPVVWSLVSKVSTMQDLLLVDKLREMDEPTDDDLSDVQLDGSDPCFLQFTSGSTSDPKGVIVSHGNLVANAHAIMYDGLNCDPDTDKGVSWLPLYHDMGLIGFVVAPLYAHVPVVFIPTLTFVKRPNSWMETITKYRGTITFAPNFALGLASKRVTPKRLEQLELSSLRVVGCGAEPINAETMRTFTETFAPAGFNKNALMPAYGMAEATLAISFDRLDRPFRSIQIDREAYEADHTAIVVDHDGIELVSCGTTFPGHEVRVMDDNGNFSVDGQVGEIVMRGPSVTHGYFGNSEATGDLLKDDWLHTGDLGFVHDGEVYVSGRKKDLVILNGRNYYPQAIEWEVEQLEGVRRGNVVAFSVPGKSSEELVVVAETKHQDKDAVAADIRKAVHEAFGVRPRDIFLCGAGSLPKTSSGKLQRRKTRLQYMDGSLGRENRSMGSTATKVAIARHFTRSAVARFAHGLKKSSAPARKMASKVLRNEAPERRDAR